MMGFIEWVDHERKRKEKEEKKNVRSNSQTGGAVGRQIHPGETPRCNHEIELENVSYFPAPELQNNCGVSFPVALGFLSLNE